MNTGEILVEKPQFKITVRDTSRWQRLKARFGLTVLIGHEILPETNQTTALYLFKCKKCKQLRVDFQHYRWIDAYFKCYECEYQNWK